MSRTTGKLALLAGLILGWGLVFGPPAAAAEKVYAKHILFPANEEEKAKEVLDQLKNGEISWDEACAKYGKAEPAPMSPPAPSVAPPPVKPE